MQQTYYEHLNVSNNISQLNENLKVLKQEKELQQKDLTKLSHQSNEKQLELLKVHLINYDIQEPRLEPLWKLFLKHSLTVIQLQLRLMSTLQM